MSEKVVVATDGGVAGRAALDWVIDRGRRVPLKIEVVTVEEPDWLSLGGTPSDYHRGYLNALADADAYLAHRHGISFVSTALLSGRPAAEIAGAAQFADLLVIGSRMTPGALCAPHSTLALGLAAHTSTRLVVVPADWKSRTGHIVVGVTDDEESMGAVRNAAREAALTGRALMVVHAWSLPAPFSIVDALLKTTYPRLEAIHRRVLDDAVSEARRFAPRIDISQRLKFGKSTEVLMVAAQGAGALFLGAHAKGVVGDLLRGSVSRGMIMAAPCPIVVVPTGYEPQNIPTLVDHTSARGKREEYVK